MPPCWLGGWEIGKSQLIQVMQRPFITIMIKTTKLSNGLRIITENIPDVHSASVTVLVGAGSSMEYKKINGVSHFIEHLMFKGTKTRTSQVIAQLIEDYGGTLNAFTDKEFSCYYARVLTEQVVLTVDIFCDMLLNSLFNPEELELERQVILEEIKMYEDTPDEIIYDLLFKAIWDDHPLAFPVTGECDSIIPMTRDDIVSFVNDFYTPDNIIFSLAGNFDDDQVVEHIKSHFENLNNSVKSYKLPSLDLKPVVIVNEKDIEQVHLCVATRGIPVDHVDRYPLAVIDIALAGGISSRLFQEVREKRGMAYTINSYKAMYRPSGVFGVYAGTSSNNIQEVIKIILNEFDVVRQNALTEEELTRAKKQLKGCMLLGLESMYYRSYRNAHSELYFNSIYSVEEVCQLIDSVSVEDIKRVAGYIFTPEYYALSIVGPKNTPKEYSLATI